MKHLLTSSILSLALAMPALADWREELPVLRVGLLGGENEADRLRRNECFEVKMEERLGIEVQLFPASDYAGVMQGLLASQLDMAGLGASAYAGIYLQDPNAVEPIVVNSNLDRSLGYYSVLYTKTESGLRSLEDLEGKTLAWADPNSTSGYLVPKAELELAGIDTETYFSETGFGGGHEQAVIAVLNDQYDAGATWISGQGEKSQGFSRGNLRRMVDNGLLDMDDIEIVWTSNIIPNGPVVVRQDMPQEAKDLIAGVLTRMHIEDPACYADYVGGDGDGYVAIGHEFYEGVVKLRELEIAGSR